LRRRWASSGGEDARRQFGGGGAVVGDAADGRRGSLRRRAAELAIFADTLHEPPEVYEHLDWLEEQVAGRIEIARVSAGDLLEVATSRPFNPIPLYLRNPDGSTSIGRRQCTKEFKLYPIRHELRRRGIDPVEMWVGISLDEFQRMKPSGLKWMREPLAADRAADHQERLKAWFASGTPAGGSRSRPACSARTSATATGRRCATTIRRASRAPWPPTRRCATPDGREQFVSSSMVPLPMLQTAEDLGQVTFDCSECEGMCGV
jgi:hypothetical protein